MHRSHALALLLAIAAAATFGNPAAAADPETKRAPVTTADKKLKVVAAEYLDKASFSTYGRLPAAEDVEVEKSKVLVAVEVETDFPKAPGWNMAGFALQDKSDKAPADKLYKVTGFTIPRDSPKWFYPADRGAAGGLTKENKVFIVENPLGKPQQVYFGYAEIDGKQVNWTGGKATVRILFEVPKDVTKLELVNRSCLP